MRYTSAWHQLISKFKYQASPLGVIIISIYTIVTFLKKKIARKHLRYVSLNIKLFHFLLSENNVTYPKTIHKNNDEEHYSSSHSISLTHTFLRNLQCLSSCLVRQKQSLGKPLTNHQSIASASFYLSHGANQSMFSLPSQLLAVQLENPILRDQIRVFHTHILPRSIPRYQRIVYSKKIGVKPNLKGNL